ncbi:MAG: family 1 glycosylhydrolase [Ferruginibacter sp.]
MFLSADNKPEIWGGIECTINRVNDTWLDQSEMCGLYRRENDLEAIAALGIKTLRFPVLWEYHQPEIDCDIDFSWAEKQLDKLKSLDITPIVGLIHHGSGPSFTNLLDDSFPEKLAAYADKVAKQFPWVKYYTPVNEPFTTARFSGLYGLWYPHKKNDVSCIKMLLNQLKGTILSMQAIRAINPDAKLIQTEDLGKTYSTELLSYQAKFENQRRWLTYDILCGKMKEDHPLWKYFMRLGITKETLQFFIDNVMPPDIIGSNYYVTSERYLDENMDLYPERSHGGNSLHNYADVESIRVKHSHPHGFKILIKEMWNRYKIPIAVTEAHLHCAREEQLKWFKEIYDYSIELKAENINIIAVTTWSLFGAYGWNKLLTTYPCEYERGAFDVSSGNVRPTAMAGLIRTLIEKGNFESRVISRPGWWKSELRYFSELKKPLKALDRIAHCGQPILIIGKSGTLGKAFAKICDSRSFPYILLNRQDLDIANYEQIDQAITQYDPWVIINAAGYVRVDDAEMDEEKCFRENTTGSKLLAKACNVHNIKFLTFSSDLIFDGNKTTPYFESDELNPLNVYGRSKAVAEKLVLKEHPSSLVIRTSAFFSPWDQHNFVHQLLNDLGAGKKFYASDHITISPTYVPHLVNACLDLLIDNEKGIWHITNNEEITWYEFARLAAGYAGLELSGINKLESQNLPALRPLYSALQSERGILLPPLHTALMEYFEEEMVTM